VAHTPLWLWILCSAPQVEIRRKQIDAELEERRRKGVMSGREIFSQVFEGGL